jgi:RNA-directed DNA polymerase
MAGVSTSGSMSPKLLKVAERAKREPEAQFNALAYLLDVPALERAYRRIRKDAAVGVDGVTHEQYGQRLEENLRDLHERMKSMRYRHQPIRRVDIPKEDGTTRPIGVAALEDKIVQGAIREVLEAIYEQDFLPCSHGFRPNRGAHDALRVFTAAAGAGKVNWVLEADVRSFFDSVDRAALMEMLRQRVADGSMLRLIGKCLHVGVLAGEEYSEPEVGTTQGSALSPLLGNIYLHHVLDLWFEREVRPRLGGSALLVRYADDFVMGFEREEDAKRVEAVLAQRLERFGLKLNLKKTRLLDYRPPPAGSAGGKGSATFDFLGFTLYWRRTRKGGWRVWCKTRSARLTRASQAIDDWCRQNRHRPVQEQHAALGRRIRGHAQYFGVNGNFNQLKRLVTKAERSWLKWLRRRSQRSRLNWKRFQQLLKVYPLPRPKIVVQIWGT